MKKVFLVTVTSALLATFGFAQAPAPGSNTDPASVKGCLGGSAGNYTVVEDGTGQILKITTSSVDLAPHVGHDVALTGQKASGAASSGPADNSLAVTALSMISEHCAAAAAPAATVIPPSETVIAPTETAAAAPSPAPPAPVADAAAPAPTVSPSATTVTAPAVDAAAPATTVGPSAAAVSTPPVDSAPPAATVGPSAAVVKTPAVDTPRPTRQTVHARKDAAAQAAVAAAAPTTTASPASDNVVAAATEPATPAATPSPAPETASAPDPTATPAEVTHRASSLPLLIAFVVLVIVLGTTAPLIGRWRKRKMLERDGSPNLSFTNSNETEPEAPTKKASSDQNRPEPRKVA